MRDIVLTAPRLVTPRLELRPLGSGDIDAIVDGVGNYDVARWLSSVPYPYSSADAEAFLNGAASGDGPVWAIDAGRGLIGIVSVTDELGYWLARPAWGGGLGFEAVRAAVEHWFDHGAATCLRASHYPDNHRSALLLACLGFEPTGQSPRKSRALSQEVIARDMLLTRDGWTMRRQFDVRTARLRLRPLERTDARALVSIATPPVARMVSSIPEQFTLAAAKAFINKRRWRGLPGFLLAVEGPEGSLVGCIGCGGDPVTAMIFLGEDHWGRGYATEASLAFVDELFRRFPLSAIHAEHFTDNPASGAVLEKVGFERVGEHTGTSEARLEPAPVVQYRLSRDAHRKHP